MNVMIALPGGKFFAIPLDVLETYAVPKTQFDAELGAKARAGESLRRPEVEGQEEDPTGGAGPFGGTLVGTTEDDSANMSVTGQR